MNTTTSAILATFVPPILGIATIVFVGSNVSQSYEEIFNVLALTSLGALVLGTTLLISIASVAKIARGNRAILLAFFRPLLKLTQLGTVLLVAFHAITITISIYFLEAYFLGRVHFILIGAVGIVSAWTALKIFWFSITKFKMAEAQVLGKVVKREDQAKLWSIVDEVCRKTKSDPPHNIVLGLSPNFFVTEAKVNTHDERVSGKTLYLSLPFGRLLTEPELKAIIAHEMGHFVGMDTRFSKYFYPIYRGAANTISLLSSQMSEDRGGTAGLALIPSLAINSFFLEKFSAVENEIGRKRELEADRIASDAYGNEGLATALVKVHAYGAVWSMTEDAMTQALAKGQGIANSSTYFETFVRQLDMARVYEFLGDCRAEHPTDSHPPLKVRLSALNYQLTIDGLKDLQNQGESNVASLIADIVMIEEELTRVENEKLIAISSYISQIKRVQREDMSRESKKGHLFIYHEMLRKMLILTAMIDGKIEDQERDSLTDIVRRITGENVDQDDLIADINSCDRWSHSLLDMLDKSKEAIDKEGKILLIKAVLLVAASDGSFTESEQNLVTLFSSKLGLSEYDLKKVMEDLFSDDDGQASTA